MLYYFLRRLIYMVIIVWAVSVVAFVIIQLPPGDYLTSYIMQLEEAGTEVSEAEIASLRKQYGLDQPIYLQYFYWIYNIVCHGDFGRSFQWNKPVSELIWERIMLTAIMGLCSTVFLALVLMFMAYKYFGASVGGLFSPQYIQAPWSIGKVLDMLSHLWIPVVVLGTAGTAGTIRVMRGCLLDELQKQYVITARAKGVKESILLFKYPVRVAINPIISTIGWRLTAIISGAPIVAMVLSLPTTGPLMLRALMSQDMYLAGSFFLLLCILTIIGTFISDILLALLDPRIRMERRK